VQPPRVAEIARHAHRRMLDQIAPDAGQRRDHRDVVFGKLVRRADTAAHQHGRRMDRSAGEDQLASVHGLGLTAACDLGAGRARAFEQDAPHEGLGTNCQVFPRAHCGRQIRHRTRYALVILVDRGRDRHHAVFPFAVLVRHDRQAALAEHVRNDLDEAGPVLDRISADGDRALMAVILAVDIQIAFGLAEVRQHRRPVPARRAHLLPAVVVARRAAIGDEPVDARAAAENARLLVARAPAVFRIVGCRAAE
jgi:hypothetical protein